MLIEPTSTPRYTAVGSPSAGKREQVVSRGAAARGGRLWCPLVAGADRGLVQGAEAVERVLASLALLVQGHVRGTDGRHEVAVLGARSARPGFRPSTSSKACATAALQATPPWKRIGGVKCFPLPMTLRKLRARARHSPARMSARGVPSCCRWIMSDLAKTVQRPAIRAGLFELEGQAGELAVDGDAEALGLLVEEGAGARGAQGVHGEVHEHHLAGWRRPTPPRGTCCPGRRSR